MSCGQPCWSHASACIPGSQKMLKSMSLMSGDEIRASPQEHAHAAAAASWHRRGSKLLEHDPCMLMKDEVWDQGLLSPMRMQCMWKGIGWG